MSSVEISEFLSIDPLGTLIDQEKIETHDLDKLNKKRFTAWVLYDVGNTFYASGILSLVAFTWILAIGQQNNGLSYAYANLMLNIGIAVASVIMAIAIPILGSMSDVTQQRKNYVVFFTIVCLIATIGFILADSFWTALIVFSVSMIAYQWAQVFYDTMLPGIVPPGKEARLSSIAITIGYLGGAMITFYAFFLGDRFDAPNAQSENGPITFGYAPTLAIAVVIGFALLALPLFFVRETDYQEINKMVFLNDLDEWETIYEAYVDSTSDKVLSPISVWAVTKQSIRELKETFHDIRHNNQGMFYYIIAYFIIADLANLMALINIEYLRSGVGLSEDNIFIVIFISGIGLIIITPIIGIVIDKYGAKNGYRLIAWFWGISLVVMILQGILLPTESIYFAAIFFGPALSGVWVSQRQMVLELVPNEESIGRYFGLSKFSGKLSSAIGPLIYGGMFFLLKRSGRSTPTSFRVSILVLGLFLGLGFYILKKKVPNKSVEFKQRKQRIMNALQSTKPPSLDLIDMDED